MIIYFLLLICIKNIFSEPYCKEGVKFCFICNNVTKLCEKCIKDIYSPDNKGGCKPSRKCNLGKGHCLECYESENLCKVCEDRYYPDENGGCSYTHDCEISYMGECLKCKDDFILVGTDIKICKSLNSEDLKNCKLINITNGLCDLCKEGFYLNSEDKKCISIENCAQSSFGVCNKCSPNYYLDKKEDKCKEQNDIFKNCKLTIDGINCDTCDDYFYFNEERKCIDINYCEKESTDGKCERCVDDYYPTANGNSCSKDKNCLFGNKDYGLCYQCLEQYYIDFKDGRCKSNIEENDFKYCKSADGECNECIYRTYIGKDNKCSFSKYCAESEGGKCIQCIENYHLGSDEICNGIEKCIYTDFYGDCTECEDNYYYNKSSKVCELEKENFENCKITTFDGQTCNECKYDFYLNRTDNLCYSNTEKNEYYKCKYTNTDWTNCFICVEGYRLGLIDHKCTTMDGCLISENENKCKLCGDDFYCFNAKTEKCEYSYDVISEEKKFFFRCNKTNPEGTACEICKNGYVLQNGLCVDKSHCIEKNEDGKCTKCYYKDENYSFYCLNSDFECIETFNEGCQICNDIFDFFNCTKCMIGFDINGEGECIDKRLENCKIMENENRCLECQDNYCLNSKTGLCEENYIINDEEKLFYFRCKKTNADATTCEICEEGKELRDGLCFDDQHCFERNEDGTCQRCKKKEHEYFDQCLNNIFGCIEIYNNENCLECNNVNENQDCTKCIQGFIFDKNNKCIKA